MPQLLVCDLGTMPYPEALVLQRGVARARISGDIADDVLLLVEHPPVVTLGRSTKQGHLLAAPELLLARGVEVCESERGGDVTFHGPGQIVGYPIVDLKGHTKDLHWYLRQVEEALIRALHRLGIPGERRAGLTGVWTGGRKLASIGVHARDWVTWHGFALNVTTDLTFFDLIVPCGISDVEMTSVARELQARRETSAGRPSQVTDRAPFGGDADGVARSASALGATARAAVTHSFGEVFKLAPTKLDPTELERVARSVVPT